MYSKINNLFKKNSISQNDIKYILREEGKTNIYMLDGRIISTYHPLKEFRNYLPIDHFLSPNKGIIAAASQVVNIHNGHYEMADGRSFKYRVHNSQLHDTRLLMLGRTMEKAIHTSNIPKPDSSLSQFSVMDKMPLAICIIECIPEDNKTEIEFIFRYCNKYMTEFENKTSDQIIGHTVFELFPNLDHKWLVVYADVALNDTIRTIEEYNAEKGVWVHVYCYQPMPGYCACALIQ